VEQLWENQADNFKMMQCRWFYRASEVAARFPRSIEPVAGLPPDASHKEILCSDEVDDNYLTTIERPCCVMHLEAVPPDIRACWLKGPDNFFYRSKYAPRNKKPVSAVSCPPPRPVPDPSRSKTTSTAVAASAPCMASAAGPPAPQHKAGQSASGEPAADEERKAAGSKRCATEAEAACRADFSEQAPAKAHKRAKTRTAWPGGVKLQSPACSEASPQAHDVSHADGEREAEAAGQGAADGKAPAKAVADTEQRDAQQPRAHEMAEAAGKPGALPAAAPAVPGWPGEPKQPTPRPACAQPLRHVEEAVAECLAGIVTSVCGSVAGPRSNGHSSSGPPFSMAGPRSNARN